MAILTDRLIKPVPLLLGGKSYPLLITYGVLLEAEAYSGVDLLTNVTNILMPTGAAMLSMLWAALARTGCEWSVAEVGDLLSIEDLPRVEAALQQAFFASMPERKEKKKKKGEKPSKESKPPNWPDLWASARFEFRLSDEEFREMTPRHFDALRRVQVQAFQREEFMFSRLTAKVINFSQCHPKEPLRDDYFMLHQFDEMETTPEPVTGEQVMRVIGLAAKKR